MKGSASPFLRQWAWPFGLALVTLFGLVSALLGQGGIWWVLSWLALGLPLLVGLRHILRARHSKAEMTALIRLGGPDQPFEKRDISQCDCADLTGGSPLP